MSNNNNVTVVVAKYKENTDWVSKIVPRHIVYSKFENEPNYVPVCRDSEASTYLTYIIDHYDKLTDWSLFLHGHETHWHHPTSALRTCEIVPEKTNLQFFSVNHNAKGIITTSTRIGNLIPHEIPMDAYQDVYIDIFGKEEYDAIVRQHFQKEGKIVSHGMTHSAQFFVHKDRILRRPKAFYTNCLRALQFNAILNKTPSTMYSPTAYVQRTLGPFVFEYLWHYIFGESWMYVPTITRYEDYF